MKKRNVVSNIQRFCIHDGPGIRTTVFLKGCPLRCAWCANPETQNAAPELLLKSAGCTRCGVCAAACPAHALTVEEDGVSVNRNACALCGECVRVCPNLLPVIDGVEMTAEEVMKIVTRDQPFYEASGGGVTLSGGEPLAQPAFSRELLLQAKRAGLSTCIETALFAPFSTIRELLPLLDHIYFDYKHNDTQKHRRFTGVGNELIQENILRLLVLRPDALARIPIIPGFNDSPEDVDALCNSLHTLGIREVQLMRYHNLAAPKYHALGREYQYAHIAPFSDSGFDIIVQMFAVHSIAVNGQGD